MVVVSKPTYKSVHLGSILDLNYERLVLAASSLAYLINER